MRCWRRMRVWRVNGQVVARAQIVPWLQSLGIHGVQVTDVALTPAVNDMNLVYTVQIQAEKAVARAGRRRLRGTSADTERAGSVAAAAACGQARRKTKSHA